VSLHGCGLVGEGANPCTNSRILPRSHLCHHNQLPEDHCMLEGKLVHMQSIPFPPHILCMHRLLVKHTALDLNIIRHRQQVLATADFTPPVHQHVELSTAYGKDFSMNTQSVLKVVRVASIVRTRSLKHPKYSSKAAIRAGYFKYNT
jgi:hypothetical protein